MAVTFGVILHIQLYNQLLKNDSNLASKNAPAHCSTIVSLNGRLFTFLYPIRTKKLTFILIYLRSLRFLKSFDIREIIKEQVYISTPQIE